MWRPVPNPTPILAILPLIPSLTRTSFALINRIAPSPTFLLSARLVRFGASSLPLLSLLGGESEPSLDLLNFGFGDYLSSFESVLLSFGLRFSSGSSIQLGLKRPAGLHSGLAFFKVISFWDMPILGVLVN